MAAHDDKAQRQAEAQLKRFQQSKRIRVTEGLTEILRSPNGREFLWWLLGIARISQQPFDPGANALRTAFNCGELNVGQQLLAQIIETDPASYVRMMQEQQDEYRTFVTAEPTSTEPARFGAPGSYDTDRGPDSITGDY